MYINNNFHLDFKIYILLLYLSGMKILLQVNKCQSDVYFLVFELGNNFLSRFPGSWTFAHENNKISIIYKVLACPNRAASLIFSYELNVD